MGGLIYRFSWPGIIRPGQLDNSHQLAGDREFTMIGCSLAVQGLIDETFHPLSNQGSDQSEAISVMLLRMIRRRCSCNQALLILHPVMRRQFTTWVLILRKSRVTITSA